MHRKTLLTTIVANTRSVFILEDLKQIINRQIHEFSIIQLTLNIEKESV